MTFHLMQYMVYASSDLYMQCPKRNAHSKTCQFSNLNITNDGTVSFSKSESLLHLQIFYKQEYKLCSRKLAIIQMG